MHHDFFDRWKDDTRGQRRATAAPRGFAKSTFEALIKPIHDVCYGLEKFIVIFSNTDQQAMGRTFDIKTEFLTNDALIEVFGPFFDTKRVADSKFVAKSCYGETMVMAFGAGAEVRGIKWGPNRPSKIIGDDIEHSTEVENESIRQDYENWFNDVVSELGNKETNIIVVGTILHRQSLLKKLLQNPRYDSELYRAVESFHKNNGKWEEWKKIYTDLTNPNRGKDARQFFEQNRQEMMEGVETLWEEKESYYDLQCAIVERGRRSFYKEKQNDPRSDEAHIFDIEQFDYFTVDSRGQVLVERDGRVIDPKDFVGRFGVLDPSTGKKPRRGTLGDWSCLLTGVTDRYGYLYVMQDWTKRRPPTEQIGSIFDHHDVWQYDKFGIETNLYRDLLLPDILTERKKREEELMAKEIRQAKAERRKPWPSKCQIKIRFYDIVNTEKKEDRIMTLEPKVMNGFIKFNRALSEEFYNQMESFPKGDYDDCPDALHMLYNLVNRRYEASAVAMDTMKR